MKNNRVRKMVIWLIVIATISLTIAFVAFVNTSNYKIPVSYTHLTLPTN